MKHLSIHLDNLLGVGSSADSVTEQALRSREDRAKRAYEEMLARHTRGEVGFWSLPDATSVLESVLAYVDSLSPDIRSIVVLGIGGSSLGAKALVSTCQTLGNQGPNDSQSRACYFPDNSDPEALARVFESCALEETLFIATTKSGSTAETAAQVLIVADKIKMALGDEALPQHLVVITDPLRGPLRQVAQEKGIHCFDVPANVGGRFSVMTPVGLLPAACAGFDVRAFLEGARQIRDVVLAGEAASDPRSNPALLLATLLTLHGQAGRNILVTMPYADSLLEPTEWFRQLWGESVAKAQNLKGEAIHSGTTPITFRGATDQHSQLQLFAEGPDDKVYIFMKPKRREHDLEVPGELFTQNPDYAYLAGTKLSALIDAQYEGTMASLTHRDRPTASIELDCVDAASLGAWMMLMMATTAFAGALYGVDPFDQPGVEEAKRLAFAALGRDGYQDQARMIDEFRTRARNYEF